MKSKSYQIKQERFEGPLELLLDLIEREKLPINVISLSRVANDFLIEVKSLEEIDQEALAEFLVVAAQLMLIKSRSLLPHLEMTAEDEESIEDLERRLFEYKRIREAAKLLRVKESNESYMHSREAYLGIPAIFFPPAGIKSIALAESYRAFLRTLPQISKLIEERIKKIISLEERIRDIQSRLTTRFKHMFSEIVSDSREKVEIVVSFLAILELAKQKLVFLEQGELFGDIALRSKNDNAI